MDCSARPKPLMLRIPTSETAPALSAVAPDDSAVPVTDTTMPMRRPRRSTIGPTSSTTTAVPTLTRVETSNDSLVSQPKSREMSGSSVPKRMKS